VPVVEDSQAVVAEEEVAVDVNAATRPVMPVAPVWLICFIAFSLFYIATPGLIPTDWRWFFKIIPILLLLQLVISRAAGTVRTLLVIALLFSATGDVLLAMEGRFVQGLGAFLLAQITYTILFTMQGRWQPQRLWWTGLIVLYALLCTVYIVPEAGNMKVPIVAYMVAISLMAISAGFREDSKFLWVAIGALVFMVSDTLIAVNRFVISLEYSGIAVMGTYYLAQALICTGVLRS